MEDDIEKVVAGFTRLNASDRRQAVERINEFANADSDSRRVLREKHEVNAGIDLGPTNQGGCPCCGK